MSNLLNRGFLLFCALLVGLILVSCGADTKPIQTQRTAVEGENYNVAFYPCDGLAVEPQNIDKLIQSENEYLYVWDCVKLINPMAEQVINLLDKNWGLNAIDGYGKNAKEGMEYTQQLKSLIKSKVPYEFFEHGYSSNGRPYYVSFDIELKSIVMMSKTTGQLLNVRLPGLNSEEVKKYFQDGWQLYIINGYGKNSRRKIVEFLYQLRKYGDSLGFDNNLSINYYRENKEYDNPESEVILRKPRKKFNL